MTTRTRHFLHRLCGPTSASIEHVRARASARRSLIRARRSARSDEDGAVLILALVFLAAVGILLGGLTDWTTNDLMNSLTFKSVQSTNSSATNAVNLAIQNIRSTPLLYTSVNNTLTDLTLNASPPNYCWGAGPSSQAFGMNVYCSSTWNPASAATRQVTVSACPTSRAPSWAAGQTSCPAQPFLQAVVTFDDYPPGVAAPSQVQCVVWCGSGLTINSWSWNPAVPTISSMTGLHSSSSIDGGQPITIMGSGFTSGSTVNFVVQDPLAQVKNPATTQIVPATNVVVNTSTQTITAMSPAVTTLANYYITVTTPGAGTSATNSNFVFDYTAAVPIITNISPTSGYTTHGTAITITGSGFVNGATVTMVEETNNIPNTPYTAYSATAVQVVSNKQITAITYPYPTSGTTWYVQVTTPSGSSTYVAAGVFTFTPAPA